MLAFFTSSIGRKLVMSLTGLGLAGFLLAHVAGNLLLFVGPDAVNQYSAALHANMALLYIAEAGLVALVVLHIYVAIVLTRQNRAARPEAYVMRTSTGRSRRFWGSSNMAITGLFVVFFVIFHLNNFKWGPYYTTTLNGSEVRDIARLLIEDFQKPVHVLIYVIAMLVIGMHLHHGFRSSFETLGLAQTKWDKLFTWVSRGYTILVFGGFISIPLYIFFGGIK